MDPWLSNRLVLLIEDDHPNADEVSPAHNSTTFSYRGTFHHQAPQEDQIAEQVEFLGQNSPLFGQELEHLLSSC